MEGKEESTPTPEPLEDAAPLPKGAPLTREESIVRMYERYDRTFEVLAR